MPTTLELGLRPSIAMWHIPKNTGLVKPCQNRDSEELPRCGLHHRSHGIGRIALIEPYPQPFKSASSDSM
ncbi:hypothetical protein VTH06DRAFT_4532 [Thermothelomyces fergusii]